MIKAASTALVVVTASLLAETFGPFWGALITSLPVSAGPAYVFLALSHSDGFIATAALNSFVSVTAVLVYLIAYALAAQRMRMLPGLGGALLAWLAASVLLRAVEWTVPLALLVDAVAFVVAFGIAKRIKIRPEGPRKGMARRWFDLPMRAGMVAGFVLLIVSVADFLGPQATGIASVFPIAMSSLMIILRPRVGAGETAVVALLALQGMIGLAGFMLTLHLTAEKLGTPWALAAGLAVQLGWSGVMWVRRKRA